MPQITLEGPRIESLDKKRTLVKELTESACAAYGLPPQAIVVVIKENPPECVGIGGELLCDKKRE